MKKRISSLILAFSILLSIVPLGVLTTFAQDTILYGDADGNGKVDMSDVNLMERYIDGDAEAINGIRFTEADVNVDEVVDEVDLALVKEYPYAKRFDTRTEGGKAFGCYILYKRTHMLDTAEMSRLIRGTVEEAKSLGIETATPEEISKMLSLHKTEE